MSAELCSHCGQLGRREDMLCDEFDGHEVLTCEGCQQQIKERADALYPEVLKRIKAAEERNTAKPISFEL